MQFASPRDARAAGIETIYQTLALADNLDTASNLFLGRELRTRWGTLDTHRMSHEAQKVVNRINPHFIQIHLPVQALSGASDKPSPLRALYFNAKILIMDESCAALGPAERRMVMETIQALKREGIVSFLSVMKCMMCSKPAIELR